MLTRIRQALSTRGAYELVEETEGESVTNRNPWMAIRLLP